ncbi:CapA family protein, partial [Escherichia coli]|nr:CapA family protein [Escherichia coli]
MSQQVKYYGYTGDLVLQDTDLLELNYFSEIKKICIDESIGLIVNLESPFIYKEFITIKDKVCLGANQRNVDKLHYLSPKLINLSNNHINDFGNDGVQLTLKVLLNNNFNSFGVGKRGDIKIIDNTADNLINMAFTLRSSDQSGSLLFATDQVYGPSDLDLELISEVKKNNATKNLVVSVHWGTEDISIPDRETRIIARKIIDAGADLVIGHHPHIVQPLEIYKEKMIFYSVGNFYFPDIKYSFRNKIVEKKTMKHQLIGIVPVFDFSDTVRLVKIYEIRNNDQKQIVRIIKPKKLIKSKIYYSFFP